MPVDWSNYPANWRTEIRPRILARDGHRCHLCGVPNYAIVLSKSRDVLVEAGCFAEARRCLDLYHEDEERAVIVVLTVAHLDHDTANNADANLAALCQRCHLTHDGDFHAASARATRERKRTESEPLLPSFG